MDLAKPYLLPPRHHEKIWGSMLLEPWFPNSAGKTGEVWFVEPDSPVLIKFLFTTENLSIQVHPGDEYAERYEGCRGKTEMWHILRAEPDAKIALGLHKPVTDDEMRSAVEDGSIMELLRWIPVKPGDTYFIPAGAIHAIGAGLALCEIQQHSDITYRLYDYGRPRELHVEQSLATMDVGFQAQAVPPEQSPLVKCPYFTVDRVHFSGTTQLTGEPEHEQIAIILSGQGTLNGEKFHLGQVWKLPPASTVTVGGEGELIHVRHRAAAATKA